MPDRDRPDATRARPRTVGIDRVHSRCEDFSCTRRISALPVPVLRRWAAYGWPSIDGRLGEVPSIHDGRHVCRPSPRLDQLLPVSCHRRLMAWNWYSSRQSSRISE